MNAYSVSNESRLTLTGAGNMSGPVTVGNAFGNDDTILAPGDGVGMLSVGSLELQSDATFRFEFDSVDGIADMVRSAGSVSLMNPKLVVLQLSAESLPFGTEFLLIENTGNTGTTGQFVNLPQGADIQAGENFFRVDYAAAKGVDGVANDIVLRVVPEPATGLTLLSSLLLGRSLFRRRGPSMVGSC